MCPSFEFDSSLSPPFFFCVKEKDASGLTDQSLARKQEDGCDLDRTYVRDKRFLSGLVN